MYDQDSGSIKKILLKHFDESKVNGWLPQARRGFENLILHIPFIGGKDNLLTRFLVKPSRILPLVKILKDEGTHIRKIGQIMFEVAEASYDSLPRLLKQDVRRKYFKKKTIDNWRKQAEKSQLRRYPMDWVFEFVEGDEKSIRYGLKMTECGLLKFWRNQGLEEYVPYLCMTDWAYWKALGVKANRTKTLANGHDCCNFVYYGTDDNLPRGWPPESLEEWHRRHRLLSGD